MPSSRYVKPQISDQIAVGYFRNFADNSVEMDLDSFATLYSIFDQDAMEQ